MLGCVSPPSLPLGRARDDDARAGGPRARSRRPAPRKRHGPRCHSLAALDPVGRLGPARAVGFHRGRVAVAAVRPGVGDERAAGQVRRDPGGVGPRAEGRRPHRRGPPPADTPPHPTPRPLLLLASPQPAAARRQVVSAPGLTPVIFIEVAPSSGGAAAGTVLLYGHADTQPPFVGWSDGLSPYKPTLRDGKLYGRGACDDGYSIFAAVTAIMALKAQVPGPLPPPALAIPCRPS